MIKNFNKKNRDYARKLFCFNKIKIINFLEKILIYN